MTESGKDKAFCFPEEGGYVGVEQEVLFHGIALHRVPGDSPVSGGLFGTSNYSLCAAVSFLQREITCTDAN